MNDPTNWTPEGTDLGIKFASNEDAKKAEALFNQLLQEGHAWRERAEKAEAFIEQAFRAHPNLDLDIAALQMDDKTQRILLELEEQLAGAVMSKFVSQRECTAYRGALIDAMERIRRLSAAGQGEKK
jgi:hypothetical protein